MKKNTLLKPLLYSVLILILLGMMVYQIAGNPEASAFSSLVSSIGMLCKGTVRTVQWLCAMLLALAVCLAFLFALFLGAVALFDRTVAARMYGNLKANLLGAVRSFMGSCCATPDPAAASGSSQEKETYYEVLQTEMDGIQDQLQTTRQSLTGTIDRLAARIENLEALSADMVGKQELAETNHQVQSAAASLAEMEKTVSALQSSLEQTAGQVNAISPDKILGDFPQRLRSLEEQQSALEIPEIPEPVDITPLRDDIRAIQAELGQVQDTAIKALQAAKECCVAAAPAAQEAQNVQEAPENPPEPDSAPVTQAASPSAQEEDVSPQEGQEEDHRLLSYFADSADREKLVRLVTSTLDKNMSYKQVLNLLVKEFGPVKGKIISSHPSLSKDFIRQCRSRNR